MSHDSRAKGTACRFLVALFALACWPGVAATQEDAAGAAPANAHMKRYGSGWECDRGYRKVRRSCVAVEVPANAYLNVYGDSWECDRGYRKLGEACELIAVPDHAREVRFYARVLGTGDAPLWQGAAVITV